MRQKDREMDYNNKEDEKIEKRDRLEKIKKNLRDRQKR